MSGGYSFLDIPADVYAIEARDPAQHYATMVYNNESPYYQPDYIQADGGSADGLDFSMPVAAHIQGTVDGPPPADLASGNVTATVEVQDDSSGSPVWFDTGDAWPVAADGTYDVGDLPPDDYRLKVSDSGNARYATVTTPMISVVEGQTVQHVDVTMKATAPGGYVALAPSRLLDTRSGVGVAAGPVAPFGTVSLQVTGQGGVPSSGVSAVVLNVTVAGSTAGGYVTVYADGEARPTASNLNYVTGQMVPNLVIAPGRSGRQGAICTPVIAG